MGKLQFGFFMDLDRIFFTGRSRNKRLTITKIHILRKFKYKIRFVWKERKFSTGSLYIGKANFVNDLNLRKGK